MHDSLEIQATLDLGAAGCGDMTPLIRGRMRELASGQVLEVLSEEPAAHEGIYATQHGRDDAERATLPFVVGNVAATADQEAVVLLTVEGAWLGTKGYADTIHKEGFQPLTELMQAFVENGGQIWA